MAGNTADPFGDYDDVEYDVSDTEEEDIAGYIDHDMASAGRLEDVIAVSSTHCYLLVPRASLPALYQVLNGANFATTTNGTSQIPPEAQRVPNSTSTTCTTPSPACPPQSAAASRL